jgi:hypothetical protein
MTSRALLEFLNRVSGKIACRHIEEQMNERRPCIEVYDDLKRGVAFEK